MPIFSIDDLTKPVTRERIQTSIYQALGILAINTTSWKSGAVPRAIIVAVSSTLAVFSRISALQVRSGFLELSEGPWLDLVAHYVYRIDRNEAIFATGVATLANGGGGIFTFDPDDVILKNSATGMTYRNTAGFTLAPGRTVTVPIRATETGAAGSAGANTITELVTTLLSVTCTNPLPLVGTDDESDPQLRTRCSESLGALSPFGPADAYASAVRNAKRPDGTAIGITRIRTSADGRGNLNVCVATAAGSVTVDDVAIADAAVQQSAAPIGVDAVVVSAEPLPLSFAYELWMYNTSGRTDAEIRARIEERLRAFVSAQPISGNRLTPSNPGKVFHDAACAIIATSWPQIFHVVLTTPAGDVTVDPDRVPVLAGTPTATIHEVQHPYDLGDAPVA